MQAAAASWFVQPLLPLKPFPTHQNSLSISSCPPMLRRWPMVKAAPVASETSTVNYDDSAFSVFPVEACEIIGGDACAADMCPEARLPTPPRSQVRQAPEEVDREYFDYSSEQQSVLKGEACDDLGGEFCEAPYMSGVH